MNLLFGAAVTGVGIGTLAYFVSHQPAVSGPNAYLALLPYYLPRVTIVIVVEVFAYFFLKLYRSALEDEKYYNNEMTNVEVQSRSLVTAVLRNDPEAIRHIVQRMSEVDRNLRTDISRNDASVDESLTQLLKLVKELRAAVKEG